MQTELPQIIQDLKESKFIDVDVARFTEKAAIECFKSQQKELSLNIYRLSLSQWKPLGRQDKVLEVQQQIEELAQSHHQT